VSLFDDRPLDLSRSPNTLAEALIEGHHGVFRQIIAPGVTRLTLVPFVDKIAPQSTFSRSSTTTDSWGRRCVVTVLSRTRGLAKPGSPPRVVCAVGWNWPPAPWSP